MSATRREFIKTGLVVGAGVAARPRAAFAAAGANGAGPASEPQAGDSRTVAYTRGVGVYPGAPEAFFGPELVPDTSGTYRNLALLRPAWASSNYDYNLTAQLVTDGLAETRLPDWIATVVNGQVLPKHEREVLTNHSPEALLPLPGTDPVVELHLGGGGELPEVDRLVLFVVVPETVSPATLHYTASVSDDGYTWTQAGTGSGSEPVHPDDYPPGMTEGSHVLKPLIAFDGPHRSRFYRVELSASNGGERSAFGQTFRLGQVAFYRGNDRVQLGGPYSFTSAWKSAGMDEEWVYVDLGGRFPFDTVKLHWIARAAEGKLQVSDDAHGWRDLQPLPAGTDALDEIKLSAPAEGRYVRVLMTRPATGHGYILSELEVWGRGGFTARPHAAAAAGPEGHLRLSGGVWKLQRAPQVAAAGEAIATAGFADATWIPATVPGTTLTSYLNVGAIPDPNYGQNQLQVSDSFFYADFWYRTEFAAPAAGKGELQWLALDGINWKAEVFLNGASLGRVDGAFQRGRFNITGKLKASNALAIRIIKNDTPASCKQKTYQSTGNNGGGLGADNPTYHASIGWDWIPTIRGRNTGVWAEVSVQTTGAVTLQDPSVTSVLPLPDTSRADVTVAVFAVNHLARPFAGTLRGSFGGTAFEQKLALAPNERKLVTISPATHKQMTIAKPQLWWPVGYGDPHLHDVTLRVEERGGRVADRKSFKAGIRQMTGNEDGGALRMFINGRRFIPKGGNWGFGESMLRYRAREYDTAVRYHREMNMNMVRNWVGQIGDEAFYEACDRHGVVVMQDFWLANPWDGPIPENNALFLANARDYVARIRSHASIGLYCGRNEWYPPAPIQAGLKQILAELHPDIPYVGSSADGPLSGHGPYRALPVPEYFRLADTKLHSEIGAPAIPPVESVRAMMPERALWPQGLDWGLHDFTLQGAQGGEAFLTLINEAYGGATDVEEWIKLGEIVSYEAYRAMFEAQSVHRMGVLLWMSHPCWPSFVWQTYDFYFAPTASYFASKKGAEPLHIQWNPVSDAVEVVNYSAGHVTGLTATLEIFDLRGQSLAKQTQAVPQVEEDSTATAFPIKFPTGGSGVQFLRLTLLEGDTVRSTNFYLRGVEEGDYTAIRSLGNATLTTETTAEQQGERWLLHTSLKNSSAVPALFVRLQAVRALSGDRILPAIFEDGYFALMPGETRTLTTELREADTRGERAKILVTGFNVAS